MTRSRALIAVLIGALVVLLVWLVWPAEIAPDVAETPSVATSQRPEVRPRPRPVLPEPNRPRPERREVVERPQVAPEIIAIIRDAEVVDTGPVFDPQAHLFVLIRDTDGYPVGEAGLSIRGDCGRRSFNVTEGHGELDVDPGECTILAWRVDGGLRAFSDRAKLMLEPGDETEIVLVLPAERTGGLGVQIESTDAGIRVVRVMSGSPADRAGLREGDLITEVDGLPTTELSMDEFIATMTGPEGTQVDFVLQYDDDDGPIEEPVVVTRAFLDG